MILLGGLAFSGTAGARLGETIEEIENRVGILEIRDNQFNPDLISGGAFEIEGFSFIIHEFYKNDEDPRRCVGISYHKCYESFDEVTLSLKDAEELIAKTFPGVEMKVIKSKTQPIILTTVGKDDSIKDSITFKEWTVMWSGRAGEHAMAQVFLDSEFRPVFLVSCQSARLFKDNYERLVKEKEEITLNTETSNEKNLALQNLTIRPTDLLSLELIQHNNAPEKVNPVVPPKREKQKVSTKPDDGSFASSFAKLPIETRKIFAYLYLALYYIFCAGSFLAPWVILKFRPKGKCLMTMVIIWYTGSSLYWIYLIISVSMSGLLMMQAEQIMKMGS